MVGRLPTCSTADRLGDEVKKTRLLLLAVICSSLIVVGLSGMTGCAAEPRESGDEAIEYPYYDEIHTGPTEALAVTLEKGERFRARLWIWKAGRFAFFEVRGWRVPATLVFYIRDPYDRKIIDAGRIEGGYEFNFTAEVTGDYKMVFDDREGWCVVRIGHNSPEPLRDVSAR